MTRPPNEDYDVIVHESHEPGGRDIWRVRLGGKKRGERFTLASAIELARDLALINSRPAWLLDEKGHPLKPI